jgi:hypothetical protein
MQRTARRSLLLRAVPRSYADPYQHVNLAGDAQYAGVSKQLRQRLIERIYEAGGVRSEVDPATFPYP